VSANSFMTKPRMYMFIKDIIVGYFFRAPFTAEDFYEGMPAYERMTDFHDDMAYVRQHLDSLCESNSPFLTKEGDTYRIASPT
jgi:hypothetical protein